MTADRFDVVVVGAGPAGCVLANRLTQEAGRSVCVLEAGPDYGPDLAAWPADLRDPTLVWYQSHPWGYQHAGRPPGRPLPLPRARVVGGSSTVNACYWLRGSAADYDGWAALGNPGWSFAQLLPYFRRAETDPLGGPLHGTDGPVPVFRAAEADLTTVDRAFLAAAKALGVPDQPDFNGAAGQRPGVGPMPKNLAGGLRMNAAFTYLNAARTRPNLTLMADVLVDRVVVQNGRAVGVQTSDGRIVGGDEVVLCAGAYGSPAVLLRSGIGPPAHLQELGIPVLVDLPGVGAHLLDHPFLVPGTLRSWTIRPEHAPAARVLTQLAVKARSAMVRDEIDLHLYEGQRFDQQRGRWILYLAVSLMDARCRGRVRLDLPRPGRDPRHRPPILHRPGRPGRHGRRGGAGAAAGRHPAVGRRGGARVGLHPASGRPPGAARLDPGGGRDDLPPLQHLPDGPGRRSGRGRRPPGAGPRGGRSPGRRRRDLPDQPPCQPSLHRRGRRRETRRRHREQKASDRA